MWDIFQVIPALILCGTWWHRQLSILCGRGSLRTSNRFHVFFMFIHENNVRLFHSMYKLTSFKEKSLSVLTRLYEWCEYISLVFIFFYKLIYNYMQVKYHRLKNPTLSVAVKTSNILRTSSKTPVSIYLLYTLKRMKKNYLLAKWSNVALG